MSRAYNAVSYKRGGNFVDCFYCGAQGLCCSLAKIGRLFNLDYGMINAPNLLRPRLVLLQCNLELISLWSVL